MGMGHGPRLSFALEPLGVPPGLEEQGDRSVDLSNKRVIAIGERDGIQGEVIRDVATELGADVVFTITQCFV